jgi:hypothetical protein
MNECGIAPTHCTVWLPSTCPYSTQPSLTPSTASLWPWSLNSGGCNPGGSVIAGYVVIFNLPNSINIIKSSTEHNTSTCQTPASSFPGAPWTPVDHEAPQRLLDGNNIDLVQVLHLAVEWLSNSLPLVSDGTGTAEMWPRVRGHCEQLLNIVMNLRFFFGNDHVEEGEGHLAQPRLKQEQEVVACVLLSHLVQPGLAQEVINRVFLAEAVRAKGGLELVLHVYIGYIFRACVAASCGVSVGSGGDGHDSGLGDG